MEINYKKLGKRIQSARRETGLSKSSWPKPLENPHPLSSTIETGKRGASLETLIRIANALQVSADYFAGRSAAPHPLGALPEIPLLFFETARSGSCRCFKR